MNATHSLESALAAADLALLDGSIRESQERFPDGSRYRIEIASVEGPSVLRAVISEAENQHIRVHRVSQGSGVMMLSDAELDEMAQLSGEHDIEVGLFLGPRAEWDCGGQAMISQTVTGTARGTTAVAACVAEAERACRHGFRTLLIGDLGVLDVIATLRSGGYLPEDLRLKTSVVMGIANPATAAVLDRLGADTLNTATDLDLQTLSAMRAVTSKPLDVYVEAPDDLGGFVRSYFVPDLIRATAPVHVKLGLRNAISVYPSGLHLEATACIQAREKVRRAALIERLVAELAPELAQPRELATES